MEFSLEYLAGIFDGEGSISINKCNLARYKYRNPRYTARVLFGMVDERPVKEFKRRFGGYLVRRTNQGGLRPMWNWSIAGNKIVLNFLEQIMPLLVVKRAQAELLYKYLKERKTPYRRTNGLHPDEVLWRESVYQNIFSLNRGTEPATTERNDPVTGCDSLNSQETVRGKAEEPSPLPN